MKAIVGGEVGKERRMDRVEGCIVESAESGDDSHEPEAGSNEGSKRGARRSCAVTPGLAASDSSVPIEAVAAETLEGQFVASGDMAINGDTGRGKEAVTLTGRETSVIGIFGFFRTFLSGVGGNARTVSFGIVRSVEGGTTEGRDQRCTACVREQTVAARDECMEHGAVGREDGQSHANSEEEDEGLTPRREVPSCGTGLTLRDTGTRRHPFPDD